MDEAKNGWLQYEECIAVVCRTTKGEFLQQMSGVFLLGESSEAKADDLLTFKTKLHTIDGGLPTASGANATVPAGAPSQSPDSLKQGPFLLEFKKQPDSVWLDAFSLGRARNNDVVLRHPSVSKLHARIQPVDPRGGEGNSAAYIIEDMGSSGGTWVSENQVSSEKPTPLHFGDACRFGELQCHFVDAEMLFDILLERTFED